MCKAQSEFCLLCHVTRHSKHSARAPVNLLTMGLIGRWPGGPHQIPPDPLLPGLEGRDFLFGKCFSSPRTFSVLRVFCHHKSEVRDYDGQAVTQIVTPEDNGKSLGAGLMKPFF